jgi:3-oxoacyl-[acyl-carrier protein] reductase
MAKLSGKVALVTGASRGIGAGIALRLAQDGARVIVNYNKSKAAADEVVAKIVANGGAAAAIQADVSNAAHVERLFAEIDKSFGRIDILVNNAGILEKRSLSEVDGAHVARLFETNVTSVVQVTQAALKRFNSGGGRIVNLSSISARIGAPDRALYGASKAAVESLTRSYAAALGARNITVNAVAPGLIDTDMGAQNIPRDQRQDLVSNIILRRVGQVDDVVGIVAFLASDDSRWITGEVIVATGGYRI